MAITLNYLKSDYPWSSPNHLIIRLQRKEELTNATLSERVAERLSMNAVDVRNTLDLFLEQIKNELQKGQVVRLGDLGRFHINVRSKTSETEEGVTPATFVQKRLDFTQGTGFTLRLERLEVDKLIPKEGKSI